MNTTGQPNYKRMAEVVELAQERYPHALEIKQAWYGGRALAEVYIERHRAVIFDPEREEETCTSR